MALVDEYRRQYAWRDWDRASSQCPIALGQHVLDLGCGPGDISAALFGRGASVTGVDGNHELISAAKERYPQCAFEEQDLRDLNPSLGMFDGLWCSFTAAYIADFEAVFSRWAALLKSNAWVCIVDVDDLLGHEPLSDETRSTIDEFYEDALRERRYDFKAGRKIPGVLENAGFSVTTLVLEDRELSFNGPADPEVEQAWKARFSRMGGLKAFLKEDFIPFTDDFMRCISSSDHKSLCKVICCIGTKISKGSGYGSFDWDSTTQRIAKSPAVQNSLDFAGAAVGAASPARAPDLVAAVVHAAEICSASTPDVTGREDRFAGP